MIEQTEIGKLSGKLKVGLDRDKFFKEATE